jgi:sulfite oxidase
MGTLGLGSVLLIGKNQDMFPPWPIAVCATQKQGKGSSGLPQVPTSVSGVVAECAVPEQSCAAGRELPKLPSFTREEISKHNTLGDRVWVTYRDGVYDVTDFVPQHPGGPEKLMLAAGSAIDPYWEVFAQHNSEQVWEMLEEYRIGNVAVADRSTTSETSRKGPYAEDPPRSLVLKVNTKEPFNAETPAVLLPENYYTPNELFFVRNHLPVPASDPETYTLEVSGKGLPAMEFTLEDLKTKFPQHTVTATIQCAGNRREELGKVKEVKGISWTGGAIGNAEWTGVKLKDVLVYAGLKEGDFDGITQHIHFEGLDKNPLTGECYGASIPIEKAMDPLGDCLLAFSMNGVELPRDHGYPIRAIVPGTVGARNVKWLAKIVASDEEYDGQWQRRDYKGFSPSVDWSNVDFSKAPAIQEMPVQSLICSPQEGASFDMEDDTVTVQGLAWSGGGRRVVRVDVSGDGGQTWVEAQLQGNDQRRRRAWGWSLWEATIPLVAKQQTVQLCCKAVDDSYNVQPDSTAPIWNLRGCLSNAWHRVNINRK